MCKNQFPKSNLKRLLAAATTVTAATKENEKRKYKKKKYWIADIYQNHAVHEFSSNYIFYLCLDDL